jgi:ATP diphosphatase
MPGGGWREPVLQTYGSTPLHRTMSNIDRLLEVMVRLRDPKNGCPWDRKQNFNTIVPYTIEEAYEVVDTIEQQDMQALRDELGDLLFQLESE